MRGQAVDRLIGQVRAEAAVKMKDAETTKVVQMRNLRRWKIEALQAQLLQRLREGARREAAQRLELPCANRQLLDFGELGEQSGPVCRIEAAPQGQLREAMDSFEQ